MAARDWWQEWLPATAPALGPGQPAPEMRARLAALDHPQATPAVRAGLWLCHDFLDESHELSQGLATPDGSYWHALMHRREPDAANAKHWFRRAAGHPVAAQVAAAAAALGYRYASPFAFVDDAERARGSGTPREDLLRAVQFAELRALLAHGAAAAR